MAKYIVFQNQSYRQERQESILWSPKVSKNGYKVHAYELMKTLMPGDVVYHYVNQNFVARSMVIAPAMSHKKPEGLDGERGLWNEDGWQVQLAMHEFTDPIQRIEIWPSMKPYRPNKYSAFKDNGNGNQGYLFPCPEDWARIIEESLVAENDEIEKQLTLVEADEPIETITERYGISEEKRVEIAKRKEEVGEAAEKAVMNYFREVLPEEYHTEIKQVSKGSGKNAGHGVGYDIQALEVDDQGMTSPILVEVKGTSTNSSTMFMTSKELESAVIFKEQYRIARVTNVGQDNEKIHIISGFDGYDSIDDLLKGKFQSYRSTAYQINLKDEDA